MALSISRRILRSFGSLNSLRTLSAFNGIPFFRLLLGFRDFVEKIESLLLIQSLGGSSCSIAPSALL